MKQRIIDNIKIQIILTIISLGLVFFAHYLAVDISTYSLRQFIEESFNNVAAEEPTFDYWTNLFIPIFLMYLPAFVLLLVMGVRNLINLVKSDKDRLLRCLFAVVHLLLSFWILSLFSKLLLYTIIFAVGVAAIVSMWGSSDNGK